MVEVTIRKSRLTILLVQDTSRQPAIHVLATGNAITVRVREKAARSATIQVYVPVVQAMECALAVKVMPLTTVPVVREMAIVVSVEAAVRKFMSMEVRCIP